MKILWFSPSPSLAESYLNNKPMNAGFMKSLEEQIQNKVDLSIAFYNNDDLPSFKYGDTTYYPIKNYNSNFFSNIKARLLNKIEPESDIKKFIEIIENVRPDLIHIHGTERPFGLIQNLCTIPCVVGIQGNISVCELKFFSGIPMLDVLRFSRFKSWIFLNTQLNHFIRFKKQARREKKIFMISHNFIGRTNWDRRITKILSPTSKYFHNDEILKDAFYTGKWENKLEGILKLFTTTGPNIFKGIETIIHCASLLNLKDIKFTWKVAGIDINDEIVHIAAKSLKKKISTDIHFLGRLNDNELKESILDSNIYIGVSHIENSPNSLCEALILGTPCIATNAGGTPNFIEDGKNGVLIQDGDAYSMAGAIIEMKENYDLSINYGNNARKRALITHDKNSIASNLLEIYADILKENKNHIPNT